MNRINPDTFDDDFDVPVEPGERRPRRLNLYRPHKPKVDKWKVRAGLVERLCQYFARYGVQANAVAIARDFWGRHVPVHGWAMNLTLASTDASRNG